jgi:hypothetical protein
MRSEFARVHRERLSLANRDRASIAAMPRSSGPGPIILRCRAIGWTDPPHPAILTRSSRDFPASIATLAQLVERSFRKAQVAGSSPVGGSSPTSSGRSSIMTMPHRLGVLTLEPRLRGPTGPLRLRVLTPGTPGALGTPGIPGCPSSPRCAASRPRRRTSRHGWTVSPSPTRTTRRPASSSPARWSTLPHAAPRCPVARAQRCEQGEA